MSKHVLPQSRSGDHPRSSRQQLPKILAICPSPRNPPEPQKENRKKSPPDLPTAQHRNAPTAPGTPELLGRLKRRFSKNALSPNKNTILALRGRVRESGFCTQACPRALFDVGKRFVLFSVEFRAPLVFKGWMPGTGHELTFDTGS